MSSTKKGMPQEQELKLDGAAAPSLHSNNLSSDKRLQQLEQDLAATQKVLYSTIQELRDANEELQVANEELQTSNEELFDSRQQIVRMNNALQDKVAELTVVNSDINNLLRNTEVPTLILSRNLYIRWFTPSLHKLFEIMPGQVGISLQQIAPRFQYENLIKDIHQVMRTARPRDVEISTYHFEQYLMRLQPYRTVDDTIDGVILTFTDVSSIYRAAAALEWQYAQLSVLYRTVEIFGRTVDMETIYAAAMDGLTDALKLDRVSILVMDEAKVMRFRAWRGLSPTYRQAADGHSPWSPSAPAPQPVLVPDVTQDATLAALQPLFRQEGIGALGFIPLQFQGQLIGKFMLYYNQPHTFTYEEVQLAQTIATHVAFAIERGRARKALREAHDSLEEQVEQRTAELREQIAQRQEAQKALERSQAFLEAAQRIARVGSWELDINAGEITWSDEMYHIYGVEPQQFKPSLPEVMAFTHPDDAAASRERFHLLMTEKIPYESHIRIVRPNGEVRYVHNRNSIILDEAGAPQRLFGTSQDETERKLAEDQIVRKAEQLAALNEMGQMVVSSLELRTVLAHILAKLRTLLQAEGIFILLRQGEEAFQFSAVSGEGFEHLAGLEVPTDAGIAGEVAQTNRAVLVKGQEAVAQRAYRHIRQVTDHPIGVLLAVPMYLKAEMIGVLEAIHSQEGAFSGDNLAMLEAAAAWTSIAIANARLYEKIHMNEERLRQLTDQLVAAQEEERRRISRELHDEAGQSLTVLKLNLAMIAADMAEHPLREPLDQAGELVADTMQRLRLLAYDLRPPEIDIIGLNASLRDLCENFSQRTRLEVYYEGDELQIKVPDAVHLSFYRCLQEALTNIAKHAQATHVDVFFKHQEEAISLLVQDNGQGFDPSQHLFRGLGLLGMKERFERLGGALEIVSQENRGTRLIAYVTV